MKPSYIRKILNEISLVPSRTKGQNFLHDHNIIEKILNLAEVKEGDNILEIGPGLGSLTQPMLQRGAHVLAIEKDLKLVAFLQKKLKEFSNLQLIYDDALVWLTTNLYNWQNWKLVSSLPYSSGTRMLIELILSPSPPSIIVVVVQKEVGDRITATASTPNYGLLSILAQVRYKIRSRFIISNSCFYPKPKVNSMCIRLDLRNPPLLDHNDMIKFSSLVRKAFAMRRKILYKNLHNFYPLDWASLCNKIQLNPMARAEQLKPEEFIAIFKHIKQYTY